MINGESTYQAFTQKKGDGLLLGGRLHGNCKEIKNARDEKRKSSPKSMNLISFFTQIRTKWPQEKASGGTFPNFPS